MHSLQGRTTETVINVNFPQEDQTISEVFQQLLRGSDSPARCDTCAQNITKRYLLNFSNVADILVLSVERSVHDRVTNKDVKIVDPINIGGDLEIQIPNRQKETFTLISAIEHQGEDPRG